MERSRVRRTHRFLALLLIFSVASMGGLGVWGVFVFQSSGPLIASVDVVFPRGANLQEISEQLRQQGVIRRADVFQIAVRVLRKSRQLQAGEFRFPARVTPMEAMKIRRKSWNQVNTATFWHKCLTSANRSIENHVRSMETGKLPLPHSLL